MDKLAIIDWVFIIGFFAVSILVGIIVSKRAGKNEDEYFLGGKSMPWWLLGFSMVATTFSTDTPNLVTGIVRKDGVGGNWVWWAFLLTGMLTVFVYSKLWRRSDTLTDVEFYEIRYSGKPAAFLRAFRAGYLGIFFNIIVMGGVSLAVMKIGNIMFGIDPTWILIVASLVTLIFSAIGGFRGVLITDFILFIVAMGGSVAAAYFAINTTPEGMDTEAIGSLSNLISGVKELGVTQEKDFLSIVPTSKDLLIAAFIIPLAVQWWAAYYPGAEPGGGGYLVQRMLAAKNEKHATGATLFFNFAHYALRPWPWILVALASLLIFRPDANADVERYEQYFSNDTKAIYEEYKLSPESIADEDLTKIKYLILLDQYEDKAQRETLSDAEISELKEFYLGAKGLSSIGQAFPDADITKIGDDSAYSAMLIKTLPKGFLGLVVASLVAAFMSTISTHLNWGSSYIVNDIWARFYRPKASQKELVWVGRVSTALLLVGTILLTLYVLEDAKEVFNLLISIGAGTGLIFILRWFWWRINAWSELSAMVSSFVMSVIFFFIRKYAEIGMPEYADLLIVVAVSTATWVTVTFLTSPADKKTLRNFCSLINPGGIGWKKVYKEAEVEGTPIQVKGKADNIPMGLLAMFFGSMGVYGFLFSTGFFIYGEYLKASLVGVMAIVVTVATLFFAKKTWTTSK
ncbi:MAG: Na+:solute symporter [Spirochaetales bacterium]|nr:Na+:solute symporter [Spirochaetales bacterium]